jgi:hypothetical protein
VHLQYKEKGDAHTRSVSRIRSHALKFQALRSLSRHLANFCLCSPSHSSITQETVVPPAVLNPGLRAHHCHDPSLEALHHHPLPQTVCAPLLVIVMPPPSTSTPPPLEPASAVDLDPASFGARHCHPLPHALDTASDEGDTPPSLPLSCEGL